MILNDGEYEVDLSTSTMLAKTGVQKTGGGYDYETHSVYSLWKTAGGKFFILRDYKEFIACLFFKKTKSYGQVVRVYDTEEQARKVWLRHGGEVPSSMLKRA